MKRNYHHIYCFMYQIRYYVLHCLFLISYLYFHTQPTTTDTHALYTYCYIYIYIYLYTQTHISIFVHTIYVMFEITIYATTPYISIHAIDYDWLINSSVTLRLVRSIDYMM